MALGYYRQPTLHKDTLIFVSEDDLWLASFDDSINGRTCTAARLTTAAAGGAQCMNPVISPDGAWVAFASTLGGNSWDVWIAPIGGGQAERLTFEGVATRTGSSCGLQVCGWHPEGSAVLYSTPSFSPLSDPQLVLVSAFGAARGERVVLPLACASAGIIVRPPDAAADVLFFVRLPYQGSACLGYRGGFVQQIYRWCADGGEAVALTASQPGTSCCPMWDAVSARLAFLSDSSGVMEVWSCSAAGEDLRRHSDFGVKGLEACHATLDAGRIVVEASADLCLVHLEGAGLAATEDPIGATPQMAVTKADGGAPAAEAGRTNPSCVTPLRVMLRSAREALQPRPLPQPMESVQHHAIAPAGDSAVFVIRGRVFVVPLNGAASNGVSRNRARRVVECSHLRGLRVRAAEFTWGDSGVGNWLLAVASRDGLPERMLRSDVGERTFTTRIDTRAGQLAFELDSVSGESSPVFSELDPASIFSRAGVMRGDVLTAIDGYTCYSHTEAFSDLMGRPGERTLTICRRSSAAAAAAAPLAPLVPLTTISTISTPPEAASPAAATSVEAAGDAAEPSPAPSGVGGLLLGAAPNPLRRLSARKPPPPATPATPPCEMQLWRCALNGTAPPVPMSRARDASLGSGERTAMILQAVPSPNGLAVAYMDADAGLHLHDCRTGTTTRVASGRAGVGTAFAWRRPYSGLCWSPDSEWLAFTSSAPNSMLQVYVLPAARPDEMTALTSDRYSSWSPSFSIDGQLLYFLSERQLQHSQDVFGARAEQPCFSAVTGVYAVPRAADTRLPWRFRTELLDEAETFARRCADDGHPLPVDVLSPSWSSPAAASELLEELPVPLGAYVRLECVAADRLLLWSRLNDELLCVDVPQAAQHGDYEAKLLHRGVAADFRTSPNGERVLLRLLAGGAYYIASCGWSDGAGELKLEIGEAQQLRTSELLVRIEPAVEWRETFVDAWRQARDTFWDAGMGGVDWAAVFRQHERLLPRIGSRSELFDLLQHMFAQLRVLHCSALSPPPPRHDGRASEQCASASLGAVLRTADDGNGVEVSHVHQGDPERPSRRAPLAAPLYGARVRPGEIIAEVNGAPVHSVIELEHALLGQVGKQLRLRLLPPRGGAARGGAAAAGGEGGGVGAPWLSFASSTTVSRPSLATGLASSLVSLSVSSAVSALTSTLGVAPREHAPATSAERAPRLAIAPLPVGRYTGSGSLPAARRGGDGEALMMHGREAVVVPISSAASAQLRRDEWLERARARVEVLGGGVLGYVSLREMDHDAYARFAEQFFPLHDRQGLIVDVRHNRGGNIDSWVLERLLRRAWLYFQPRVGGGYWNMPYAFRGHMVVLVDQQTQSNAEAFAEGFRRAGLGPVVGMRTWGGQIWVAHGQWLQDGGRLSIAEIGAYGEEGEWLIEGHGVEPDVHVDNPPHATYHGADAQLEAAAKMLLDKLEREPVTPPCPPPYPCRQGPASQPPTNDVPLHR